jgi:hypothetical protein
MRPASVYFFTKMARHTNFRNRSLPSNGLVWWPQGVNHRHYYNNAHPCWLVVCWTGDRKCYFLVLAKGRCSYLVSLAFPKAIVVAGPLMLFSSFGELTPSPRFHQRIYTPPKILCSTDSSVTPPRFSQLSRRKVKSPPRAILRYV